LHFFNSTFDTYIFLDNTINAQGAYPFSIKNSL